jgi:hypothetical protein
MSIWGSNPLKMTSCEANIEAKANANRQKRLRQADALIEKDLTRKQSNLKAGLGLAEGGLAGIMLVALSTLPPSVQEPTAQVGKQTNQVQLSQTEPNTIKFGNPGSPRSQANLLAQAPESSTTQNPIPAPGEVQTRPTPVQREPVTILTSSMPIVRPQDNSSMPNARRSSN